MIIHNPQPVWLGLFSYITTCETKTGFLLIEIFRTIFNPHNYDHLVTGGLYLICQYNTYVLFYFVNSFLRRNKCLSGFIRKFFKIMQSVEINVFLRMEDATFSCGPSDYQG